MNRVRLLLVSLTAAALVASTCACAKKSKPPEPQPEPKKEEVKKEEPAPEPKQAVPEPVSKMILNFQRVHFEFNSSDLNQDTKDALKANTEIMQTETEIKIEVQGHADERGTSEYNLSLGQKRAEAVRRYMVTAGIDKARIQTVSFGEEKPREEGGGETVWSKNRRAEVRITWGGKGEVVGTTE